MYYKNKNNQIQLKNFIKLMNIIFQKILFDMLINRQILINKIMNSKKILKIKMMNLFRLSKIITEIIIKMINLMMLVSRTQNISK